MHSVKAVKVAVPVRVIQNTRNSGSQRWAKIVAKSGVILHTGQLPYIKRIAKEKYNLQVEFDG